MGVAGMDTFASGLDFNRQPLPRFYVLASLPLAACYHAGPFYRYGKSSGLVEQRAFQQLLESFNMPTPDCGYITHGNFKTSPRVGAELGPNSIRLDSQPLPRPLGQ